VQGDARFGDIRIGAAALAPDLVAFASPFSWTGTTFSGDVLLNNNQSFRIGAGSSGFDLFSVALHEAGHVFGLDHEHKDTVMNAGYVFSTALSVGEIGDLIALYGVRTADAFDAYRPNNTLARATVLAGKPAGGGTRFTADGDLTSLIDVDYYKFTASAGAATVRLQARGLSLLQARVTVYDSAGKVVGTGAAADVLNNDVVLQFGSLKAGASYTVKVERATTDVFGVGAYRLTVDTGATGTPPAPAGWVAPVADGHTNDTFARATPLALASALSWDTRFDAAARGVIEDAGDTDFYRISAPASTHGAALDLNVAVWSADGSLAPRVRVFDAVGRPVAFRVLANDPWVMSVWVPNAVPGSQYVVQVSAKNPGGANGTGGYFLGADFNTDVPPEVQEVGRNTLSAAAPSDTGKLTVNREGIYQFALFAEPLAAGAGGVTMTVTDSAGKVVFTLSAESGQPAVTASQYLAAGTYTVAYRYRSLADQVAAPVVYHLALLQLSEGVGPYATTTSTLGDTTTTTESDITYIGTTSTTTLLGYWYFF
jgi:hypothetical protein